MPIGNHTRRRALARAASFGAAAALAPEAMKRMTATNGAAEPDAAGQAGAPGWRGLLRRDDVLIVDTETTGLGANAEAIEVAAIDTTGRVRFHSLAMPEGRIPPMVTAIHGLTRDMLRAAGAPGWPAIHGALAALLAEAWTVLAWNAGFDRRILEQTARRHGLAFGAARWRDLLADDRRRDPGGRHGLAAAARRERVAIEGRAHRALTDCRTALEVMEASVARRGA